MRTHHPAIALFGFAALSLVFTIAPPVVECCTTAVMAGRATVDGRALLWKNRDADDLHNQLVYATDGHFPYIGVVNKADAAGMEIWAGMNSQGFAIMNSASYNLEKGETRDEGRLMKLALQSCATVDDFQALLDKTNAGGRDVSANFGVIDGRGGAAFFETKKKSYSKYDTEDPTVAPQGFIVRSNYSDSVDLADGQGFLRRRRATALVEGAVSARKMNAELLFRDVARDITNFHLGVPPLMTKPGTGPEFAYTGDSVCRYITSSAILFVAARPGEDPRLSTMWVILGQPISGIAIPLWVAAGSVPPETAASAEPAPLNAAFNSIRDRLYPETAGDLEKYINVKTLTDPAWGLIPALLAAERRNFLHVEPALEAWRASFPPAGEIEALQNTIARQSLEIARELAKGPAPKKP